MSKLFVWSFTAFLAVALICPALLSGQAIPGGESTRIEVRRQVREVQQALTRLEEDRARARLRLGELQARREAILQAQFAAGVSSESYAEIIRNLQLQRVELTIDLAGLDARHEALEEISQAPPRDPIQQQIIGKWQAQLQLLQETVDDSREQFENGMAHATELRRAQENLVTAEVRLLEAQRLGAGGQDLTAELRDISLERAEKKARLGKVEEILVRVSTTRKQIDEQALLDRQGEQALQQLETIESTIRTNEAWLETTRQDLRQLEAGAEPVDDQ